MDEHDTETNIILSLVDSIINLLISISKEQQHMHVLTNKTYAMVTDKSP